MSTEKTKTPIEVAEAIVIEIFDNKDAPNREPFSVHEIATAIKKARYDGIQWAIEQIVASPKNDPRYANAPRFVELLVVAMTKESRNRNEH